jgi:hypothetical protein
MLAGESVMGPHLAFEPIGELVATFDRHQLLVARGGADGAPLWHRAAEAPLVAVGAALDQFVTVDEDGRLARWAAHNGDRFETSHTAVPARGLAVAPDGTAAVLAPGSLIVLRTGRPVQRVPIADPKAAAFSRDGKRIAVVDAAGRASLIDIASETLRPIDAGEPVHAIAWMPSNEAWILGCDAGVKRVSAAGGRAEWVARKRCCGSIACSANGALIAYSPAPCQVGVFGFPGAEHVELVTYAEDVRAIAFGPGHWLAIALRDGDANLIDLTTGKAWRTDPHPGRPKRTWVFICRGKVLVAG